MITKNQMDEVYKVKADCQCTTYDKQIYTIRSEAFDTLCLLYPFSTKPINTGVEFNGNKIVLQDKLRVENKYRKQNVTVMPSLWMDHFVRKYDEEKIEKIASFINPNHFHKKQIFISLHKTLSNLKLNLHEVECVFNNPIEYWTFEPYKSEFMMNVKKITFNGEIFKFYEEGTNDYFDHIKMTFNTTAKSINGVALFKKHFYILAKQWNIKKDEIIKNNNEILFKAKQLTSRYEVLRRIL